MDLFDMKRGFNSATVDVVNMKKIDKSAYLNAQEYQKKIKNMKVSKEALKTTTEKKIIRNYRLVYRIRYIFQLSRKKKNS